MSDKENKKPKAEQIILGQKICALGEKKPIQIQVENQEPGEEVKFEDLTVKRALILCLTRGIDNYHGFMRNKGNEPDGNESFKAYMLAEKLSNGSSGHSFTDDQKALVKKGMNWVHNVVTYGPLMRILDPAAAEIEEKALGD